MQSILEKVTVKDLFDVGSHFGHKKQFWNPNMLPYIYGTSNTNTHIINLQKAVPMFKRALKKAAEVSMNSGRILFVGTKMQASNIIKEEAIRCGQYYINLKWPSGMLTNWDTISQSIKKVKVYERALEKDYEFLTKKEALMIGRKKDRIEKYLEGVKKMGGLPNLIFIIDPKKEYIAVEEANKLGILIVAIVDTNCDPTKISYPIPANDDSTKAIEYYCRLMSDAVLFGIESDLDREQKVHTYNNSNKNEKYDAYATDNKDEETQNSIENTES